MLHSLKCPTEYDHLLFNLPQTNALTTSQSAELHTSCALCNVLILLLCDVLFYVHLLSFMKV